MLVKKQLELYNTITLSAKLIRGYLKEGDRVLLNGVHTGTIKYLEANDNTLGIRLDFLNNLKPDDVYSVNIADLQLVKQAKINYPHLFM